MELQTSNTVVMVGDGINDYPAMRAADIGVSITNFLDTNIITILNNNILEIIYLFELLESARKKITLCYNVNFVYNLICIIIASGFLTYFEIFIDIEKSCLLMFWSSLFILANAFSIYFIR
ncbi:ATPase Cu transporting protein 7B [Conglomerata obtusa]